jgi:hypothetical protein
MTESAESAFHAYIRAFETLDPDSALRFYHVPGMLIAAQGVFPVSDTDTARKLVSQFMAQLRSQSYRRTEVVDLTVRQLSQVLASCAGTFVRFNTAGEEIARLGFTYTMRHSDSWKIVVAILHEPVAT